ncbi:unnamed protein product [Dibothriocephalus latus]|uniref:Uncharacterized protein n=1 Tax=Dibothriocephalus latus TaxID=60516 RepID=A0A3P6TSQ5_DIBLA|nr:unnamed protein product [Dibothriocephalus latus]
MTTPNSVNRLEEGDDPGGLLRDSKVENPPTDQKPLTASQQHHGVGHGLPTLPEGLLLNSTHNQTRSNASSSRPSVSWRANTLANASPAGAVNDLETDLDGDKSGHGCCRRSPCCDLPPAVVRVLSCIYEMTAGPLAHVLFWLLIYVNLLIFTGKEALPPMCFEYKRNATAAVHAGLSAAKKAKPVAFCEGGKTLNILIFYAFATVVGVVTELMRLPGLLTYAALDPPPQPTGKRRRGGQLKTWLETVRRDMEVVLGPSIFGLRRWRRDWVELSKSAAANRHAWRDTVRDIVEAG